MESPHRVRFGVYELDMQSGDLRKGGLRIRVQEQPLKILSLLVSRPGEIITRDELRQVLWPSDTFVDFDRSLTTAVNKLREALGDRAQNPRFIETLPRRGYRFVAAVENLTQPQSARLQSTQVGRRKLGAWVIITVSSLAAVAGVAGWIATHGPVVSKLPTFLTTFPGAEVQPSLSPDGSQIAFAWNGTREDNFDIYAMAIGADRPLRLTNDPAPDLSPVWSPDGSHIAFTRQVGKGATVYLIAPTGGKERALTSLSAPVAYYMGSQLSWTAEGQRLVISDREQDGQPRALYVINTKDGSRKQLTRPPVGSMGDVSPAVAPSGEAIVFSRFSTPTSGELYLLSLGESSGEPRRLTFQNWWPEGAAWLSNGHTLVFSGGPQHRRFLWSMVSPTGPPMPIAAAGQGATQPSVSRRGERLVYTRLMWDANIWGIGLSSEFRPASRAQPVVSSTAVDHFPAFSPDGGRIAFVSNRSGVQEIWVCDADGNEATQLTHVGGGGALSPKWSPDGRTLVFSAAPEKRSQIYAISALGGPVRRITDDLFENITPSWSGEGKSIYFSSNRMGNFDVWKMAENGNSQLARRLTTDGGWAPIESADGKGVYYAKDDYETTLWFAPRDGGSETMVLDSLSNSANFAVMPTGIVFIPKLDAALRSTVSFYRFQTRSTEPILRLEKRPVWGVTASHQRLLFTQVDSDNSDLMLIDDFRP